MASKYNAKVFCRQTLIDGNYGLLDTKRNHQFLQQVLKAVKEFCWTDKLKPKAGAGTTELFSLNSLPANMSPSCLTAVSLFSIR
jgi:hypothetical protein